MSETDEHPYPEAACVFMEKGKIYQWLKKKNPFLKKAGRKQKWYLLNLQRG